MQRPSANAPTEVCAIAQRSADAKLGLVEPTVTTQLEVCCFSCLNIERQRHFVSLVSRVTLRNNI